MLGECFGEAWGGLGRLVLSTLGLSGEAWEAWGGLGRLGECLGTLRGGLGNAWECFGEVRGGLGRLGEGLWNDL